MFKEGVAARRIKCIKLPVEDCQQVLAQYADDTSLTFLGEELSAKEGVHTLQTFCLGCGLVLNWEKSCGYWKDGRSGWPGWSEQLGVTWIDEEDDISKLLGTPFGLSMSSQSMDDFIKERVNKSLRYWCTTKVNSTGRGIVVNKILLSSIFFFISIWGGSKKGVTRIKSSMASYMWSDTTNHARSKVAWLQCCQPKVDGGLDLINPTDALVALMVKWVLKACEPGTSNLHAMLRFRLSNCQPYGGGQWRPSLEYFTQSKFQAKKGSKAWNRAGISWRAVVKDVVPVLPSLGEDVLNEPFWWSSFSPQIGAGFSKNRAAQLHRAGLVQIQDARVGDRFITAEEGQAKFGFTRTEGGAWRACVHNLISFWGPLLEERNLVLLAGEWLGCFEDQLGSWPSVVFQVGPNMDHILINCPPRIWWLQHGTRLYKVLPSSNCLDSCGWPDQQEVEGSPGRSLTGTLR
jgi:hypothetical protein